MKNLSIAGTACNSKLVEVNGKQFLEINVALNHVTPCEWVKVMTEKTALTIEKGSRISASGHPEEKAYINKQGKPAVSRTLWASFCEVLYSPGKPESETQLQQSQAKTSAAPAKQEQAVNQQEVKNALEIAFEEIDSAKSLKQCNYLYYNVVNALADEEDRKIALSALNNRKNFFRNQEKRAAYFC